MTGTTIDSRSGGTVNFTGMILSIGRNLLLSQSGTLNFGTIAARCDDVDHDRWYTDQHRGHDGQRPRDLEQRHHLGLGSAVNANGGILFNVSNAVTFTLDGRTLHQPGRSNGNLDRHQQHDRIFIRRGLWTTSACSKINALRGTKS